MGRKGKAKRGFVGSLVGQRAPREENALGFLRKNEKKQIKIYRKIQFWERKTGLAKKKVTKDRDFGRCQRKRKDKNAEVPTKAEGKS